MLSRPPASFAAAISSVASWSRLVADSAIAAIAGSLIIVVSPSEQRM